MLLLDSIEPSTAARTLGPLALAVDADADEQAKFDAEMSAFFSDPGETSRDSLSPFLRSVFCCDGIFCSGIIRWSFARPSIRSQDRETDSWCSLIETQTNVMLSAMTTPRLAYQLQRTRQKKPQSGFPFVGLEYITTQIYKNSIHHLFCDVRLDGLAVRRTFDWMDLPVGLTDERLLHQLTWRRAFVYKYVCA